MEDVGGRAIRDWICGERAPGVARTPPHPVVASVVVEDEALVVVIGSVDRFSWPYLEAAVVEARCAGARWFVVDAALLSFVDATAVTRLATIGRRLRGEGGGVRVASPPPVLRRLVDLLLLGDALAVDATSRREYPGGSSG
jgi:anti-anti-sigma regulatory factor